LAHCTLRQSEPFCKTVLEFLRKNILHRDIGLSGELLHAIIANTIIHELKRREERAELHEVSRFFGHFGVKIRPVKGGVMLDGRNRIPFDLAHMERIRAIDPTIVWTDPEGKIIDAALTEPDREEPWL
jgi:hypothetical protein